VAQNFVTLVEANVARLRDRPAVVWDGGRLTWRELQARVGGCARSLHERGVRAGDRVAVILPNDWRFVVATLAILKIGATVVPINPLLKRDEIDAILADVTPRLVVDDVDGAGGEFATVSVLAAPAVILYTSGSTGRPKGAILSHPALTFANRSWAEPVMALTIEDIVLAVLPFAHSYGLNGGLLAPLLAGAALAVVDRFSPESALAAIERHRVTVFPGVATMFRRLLETEALRKADLSSLRIALSGAAPCPWEIARDWRAATGVRILRGYGMTELFRPISYLVGETEDVPDSIGRAVPGVSVKLVDDDERDVAPGTIGELWIKTPCAMDCYLGLPDETGDVLREGWFRTGDLAVQRADGFISIVGRKKELILRGGYSVYPQEVERVLGAHPSVAEVAVVGRSHPELGEEVTAFVVLRAGATAEAEQLIAFCRDRLAAYKYPRHVVFRDRLPRGATGKVIKSELAGA
jgi:long-chain acyl-CoA synthetase